MMTWGKTYWPVWLVCVLITFLGPEIYALITNKSNTLTDWVRYALHIAPKETIGQWSAADLLLFCAYATVFIVWLPFHFWFDKFS